MCEEVRARKQELDAWRNHPGLSWCEEAGSKLGCSKMPKWTISHKPRGLVLIDPGWTGAGGWAPGEIYADMSGRLQFQPTKVC